jgi:hypothetical protein
MGRWAIQSCPGESADLPPRNRKTAEKHGNISFNRKKTRKFRFFHTPQDVTTHEKRSYNNYVIFS